MWSVNRVALFVVVGVAAADSGSVRLIGQLR
jgi:hypothetical protein